MNIPPSLDLVKIIGRLSKDGMFVFNHTTVTIEYVNDALVEIFDISHQSFKYQPQFFINHVLPEDLDHVRAIYAQLMDELVAEHVEFHLRSHDQLVKTVECSVFVIDGYIVGFVRDITKQREHEDYIVSYGAKKNTLLDMVSHNLTAPLNLSRELLHSMERIVETQKSDNLASHLKLVRESTNHCLDIVTDFLEEEHLVSKHIFVKKNRFDILVQINSILERMRTSYPKKEFTLVTETPSLFITNDSVKFMQVINNLLYNGVKFSHEDGKIDITVRADISIVVIYIADNGIGIPDRLKPAIFEKNTPSSRPGLCGEKSTGMGLYIARTLTMLMGGKIYFESKEGTGSVFTVELPRI